MVTGISLLLRSFWEMDVREHFLVGGQDRVAQLKSVHTGEAEAGIQTGSLCGSIGLVPILISGVFPVGYHIGKAEHLQLYFVSVEVVVPAGQSVACGVEPGGGTGQGAQISVSSAVDDTVHLNGRAAGLVFHDHSLDSALLHYRTYCAGAVEDLNAAVPQQLLCVQGEQMGIELGGKAAAYPLLLRSAVQPGGGVGALMSSADGQPKQFLADAEHQLAARAVAQRKIDGDQAQCRHSARCELALQQKDLFPVPCSCQGGGNARDPRPATRTWVCLRTGMLRSGSTI